MITEIAESTGREVVDPATVPVTAESFERFVSLLPEAARKAFALDESIRVVSDVIDRIRDYLSNYVYGCQTRPALPHEREDAGGGRYLTKKGTAKYNAHLLELATAFEEAFDLSPVYPGAKSPKAGPLDPLIYD
ncbi:MAG TPA: hypothetical protein VGK74_02915 [Symbiobacteriaceae bacterium]